MCTNLIMPFTEYIINNAIYEDTMTRDHGGYEEM